MDISTVSTGYAAQPSHSEAVDDQFFMNFLGWAKNNVVFCPSMYAYQ